MEYQRIDKVADLFMNRADGFLGKAIRVARDSLCPKTLTWTPCDGAADVSSMLYLDALEQAMARRSSAVKWGPSQLCELFAVVEFTHAQTRLAPC